MVGSSSGRLISRSVASLKLEVKAALRSGEASKTVFSWTTNLALLGPTKRMTYSTSANLLDFSSASIHKKSCNPGYSMCYILALAGFESSYCCLRWSLREAWQFGSHKPIPCRTPHGFYWCMASASVVGIWELLLTGGGEGMWQPMWRLCFEWDLTQDERLWIKWCMGSKGTIRYKCIVMVCSIWRTLNTKSEWVTSCLQLQIYLHLPRSLRSFQPHESIEHFVF